jgi:phosphomannomutase
MHGVGGDTVRDAMRLAGFPRPIVVPQQGAPDPDFPTVAFPNPEEPGAMDLALALAEKEGADLIVANDPDADRCAVGIPGPTGWRMLRGDEVGALLADFLLRQGTKGTYATTVVSSSLLGRMAAEHGQPYAETLTGFKWLGRVPGLVFGYEEALGYCVDPSRVRDKDGVSALLKIVELTALLKASGHTLQDRLDEIARTYGLHATEQLSVRVSDLSLITKAMADFRSSPPRQIGGFDVLSVDDLAQGLGDLPPTDALRFRLAENGRLVMRPSGTEPKLKCYFEVVVPADDLDTARKVAADRLSTLKDDVSAHLSA